MAASTRYLAVIPVTMGQDENGEQERTSPSKVSRVRVHKEIRNWEMGNGKRVLQVVSRFMDMEDNRIEILHMSLCCPYNRNYIGSRVIHED